MRRSIHRSIALIALACVLSFASWAMASPFTQPAVDNSWIIWETDAPIQRLALRDGALWAGAYKGGLTRWDSQTGPQTTYSTAQGLTGADVLSAAVDARGATWVALFDGGVARISADGHVTAVTPTGIGSARPWDLATHGNEVWLATLGGGVAHEQANGAWTTYTKAHNNLPADDVYAVAVAPDGTPWIGTIDYGVAALDGTTWTHYSLPVSITNPLSSTLHLSNNAVTDIAIDASGNKWFATDGSGVVMLDSTNTQWTVYNTHNSGLKSDFVQRVVIDPQGNAWFGTLGGGVARLATYRTTWQVFDTTTARLTEDDILDLAIDGAGGLWLATYDAGLSYYGPLLATPPSFELNPRGLPAAQAGVLKGYSLWLDPETYTWTLA
jgi:streptogramin lyase